MASSKSPYQVLVVDDGEDTIDVITKILRTEGISTQGVTTLDKARQAIRDNPPHLVLLDLAIGKDNGLELLRELKSEHSPVHIPVILLTSSSNIETVSQAIALGVTDYIVKPFQIGTVKQKVSKALRSINFLSYSFKPSECPTVRVEFQGQLTGLNETSLVLLSPVKIAPHHDLSLESNLLKELGCSSTLIRSADHKTRGPSGSYVSWASFVGITGFAVKCIKDEVKSWKS